jgi:hypothetical protein
MLTGFIGGFMETNSIQTLTITKKENGGNFLITPITITGNTQFLSFSPHQIQIIDNERNIFVQSSAATGLVLAKISYNNNLLTYLPILINTPEGIALRKQNEKLMTALHLLGIEK